MEERKKETAQVDGSHKRILVLEFSWKVKLIKRTNSRVAAGWGRNSSHRQVGEEMAEDTISGLFLRESHRKSDGVQQKFREWLNPDGNKLMKKIQTPKLSENIN